MKQFVFVLLAVFCSSEIRSQDLQPGFDSEEYSQVLSMIFGRHDSISKISGKNPEFKRVYRSPVMGLDNRWEMWKKNNGKVMVICIRGTVATTPSWLANIYSVMQPATGSLKLNDSVSFRYKVADYRDAAVHTGWLIAMASLSADIEEKIKTEYDKGVKNILIAGHSQGGGIAYLLRSYLHYRTSDNTLPNDIVYKTYCSAAPKPGNLYYSYDYEFINRGQWAFNVINAADWVPETPLGIQQVTDLNRLNPFKNVRSALRTQKLAVRTYAGVVITKIKNSGKRSANKYKKYFGKKVGKEVEKMRPGMQQPGFENTLNYQRAGIAIILIPTQAYFEQFPDDINNREGIWTHHSFNAYYTLLNYHYPKK